MFYSNDEDVFVCMANILSGLYGRTMGQWTMISKRNRRLLTQSFQMASNIFLRAKCARVEWNIKRQLYQTNNIISLNV